MPEPKVDLLDVEKLKMQYSISDEQADLIAEEAMKELDNEQKLNDGSADRDDEGEQKEKESEVNDEVNNEAKAKAEEKARAKTAADEEQKKKEAIDQEIQAYAKESNLSVEEARTEIESVGKIVEKYKGDAKQLAKANLYIQRAYSKSDAELKALKEAEPSIPEQEITIDTVIKAIDTGKITLNGKPATQEQVINAYREQFPDVTDTVDDETVLKLAAKDMISEVKKHREESGKQREDQAKEKRTTLLNSLSDPDKQYLPEIEPILSKTPASAILDERFSLVDMVLWAKGKKFDTAVKEAEERGYKRGQEEAKILGEKTPSGSGIPNKVKSKVRVLNEDEKQRARDMFDLPDLTDEKKFEMFIEVESEKKK